MIKLISTSEGVWGPGSSPETSTEEKLLIENEGFSPPAENIDSIIETETSLWKLLTETGYIPKTVYSQQRVRRGGRKGLDTKLYLTETES